MKVGDTITISSAVLAAIEEYPSIKQYSRRIPRELWQIFLPQLPDEFAEFSTALKSLRLREEERNYVMELQREHEVPLRPNETVKETMIRVRLQNLRERRHHGRRSHNKVFDEDLPIDPLE